eukprot:PLAT8868.1.p2 GENE.PLAT8868.1~~PLAT8868.1.p2  ORF type:complete len:267 (+),score=142.49 PLAT8868.1:33-833(+)
MSKRLLLGAGALGLVAVAVKLLKGSKKSDEEEKVDTPTADEPALTRDALLAVLKVVTTNMEGLLQRLPDLSREVVTELSAEGGSPPPSDSKLAELLMAKFEKEMKAMEAKVYLEAGTSEDEVEKATVFYGDDEEINACVKHLTTLLEALGGNTDLNKEPTISVEKVVEIMKGVFAAMRETVADVSRRGIDEGLTFTECMEKYYAALNKTRKAAVHEKHGVTIASLQHAYTYYQEEPLLVNAMETLVAHHQKTVQELQAAHEAAMPS